MVETADALSDTVLREKVAPAPRGVYTGPEIRAACVLGNLLTLRPW
jgi:hypothetical protein